MKNILAIILATLVFTGFAFAQTTATNFIANDCNGTSHNLFDELDNGDVVVICWVMPCNPCATYAGYAANAVQSFSSSHPGRVKYYLADDFANSTCLYLNGWASNFNITTDATFSDAALKMTDYGTNGMPKVVVLGKNGYNVYYNENDNQITQSGVTDAITLALAESTLSIDDYSVNKFALKAFPNPTNGTLSLNYKATDKSYFEIIDALGRVVLTHNTTDFSETSLNVEELEQGNYIVKMSSQNDISILRIAISE